MNKKHPMAFNLGTSSILVVFVLLCLATFAALSLVSANADYRLSAALADRTTAYYEASNRAEIKLADIDTRLAAIYSETSSEEDYFSRVREKLQTDAHYSLSWDEKISDHQVLHVGLTMTYPSSQEPYYYTINHWNILETGEWEEKQTMHFLDMEAENP